MKKRLKKPTGIFGMNGNRGSVLIELMVAAIIFAIVVAAIAFYFVYHVGTLDNGRAQLKLQRVGSRLMEEMARALREGKATDLPDDDTFYPNIMITYPDPNRNPECFSFDDINKDIQGGPDYDTLSPLEVLDDSRTVGVDGGTYTHRIYCDDLLFKREGKKVIIQFDLRHDLENGPGDDDLSISFGSAVKLRG